jgi:hypothetical protein
MYRANHHETQKRKAEPDPRGIRKEEIPNRKKPPFQFSDFNIEIPRAQPVS